MLSPTRDDRITYNFVPVAMGSGAQISHRADVHAQEDLAFFFPMYTHGGLTMWHVHARRAANLSTTG